MKKTGSQWVRYILVVLVAYIGLLPVLPATVAAQDVELEATVSENPVYIGEQFNLTIEIRGSDVRNVELPRIPDIPGIRVLSTTPSRGQSLSIVNGRTTVSTSYIYTLIAQKEGETTIPPVPVRIDGVEKRTLPVSVEVLEKGSLQSLSADRKPDIFILIELDDETPVVGQQLIASLVVYFREGIEVTSYQPASGWRTDGFWKEDLRNQEQPRADREIIGDLRYRKATLLRYALFPSRAGKLTLSPFELHLGIRSPQRRNDPFGSLFGGFGSNQQRVTIETEPVDVDVRQIDPPQRGVSIGAVGSFDIERSITITEAYVGESIELVTTIRGEGNIPLIESPGYELPESFETYPPREESKLNRDGTSISGTKIFRDTFVSRTAGTFTIPAMEFAVYDPSLGDHRYKRVPEITIDVIRNPEAGLNSTTGTSPLLPVTGLAVWRKSNGASSLLTHPLTWIGFIIPVLSLLAGFRRRRLISRLESDTDFARARHAWNQALEMLETAKRDVEGEQPKNVYHFLHKAVAGFIADRLSLPEAGLTDAELCSHVQQKTGRESIHKQLRQILGKCATISYAPVGTTEDITSDIAKTEALLKQLRTVL